MQTKTIDVDGIRTSYLEAGSGFPVLFIHGLGGYKENWEANVPVFGERYRAIAIDLPGYGESDKPDVPYGPEWFAEFVVKFLRALGIERARIVGNSMGGHTAALIAAKYPGVVEKLVLVDPSGVRGKQLAQGALQPEMIEALGPINPGEDFIRMYLGIIFHKEGDYTERMLKKALADFERGENEVRFNAYVKSMRGLLGHDMTEHYAKIKAPTLVIWGENDALIPFDFASDVTERIPGAKQIAIPECGHCPQIEKPGDFNRVTADFLA
jgi:2-hydroxy-6-oxo-6-(2'-aminophenyl)hexa-2,4-dienoate hydrolase